MEWNATRRFFLSKAEVKEQMSEMLAEGAIKQLPSRDAVGEWCTSRLICPIRPKTGNAIN